MCIRDRSIRLSIYLFGVCLLLTHQLIFVKVRMRVNTFTLQNAVVSEIDPLKIGGCGIQTVKRSKFWKKSQKSMWFIKLKEILVKILVYFWFLKIYKFWAPGPKNGINFFLMKKSSRVRRLKEGILTKIGSLGSFSFHFIIALQLWLYQTKNSRLIWSFVIFIIIKKLSDGWVDQ